MSERERLPNRRLAETFAFRWHNMPYTATIGRFSDGRLAEIFLSNGKASTDADTSARDAAVTASIALQYGADLDVIRAALSRDSHGTPSGPLGLALDMVAAMDGGE